MNMGGRFGDRKNTRISQTDFRTANLLRAELHKALTKHAKYIGMKLPDNFPKSAIIYPGVGSSANERGEELMGYTLYMTRLAFHLLAHTNKKLGYTYKIETMRRNDVTTYYVSVCYDKGFPIVYVAGDYLSSLLWVIKMLNGSIDGLKKEGMTNG